MLCRLPRNLFDKVVTVEFSGLGKILLAIGLSIAALGLIILLLSKWPSFFTSMGWVGRLPGDIVVKRENFTFYFPLATSILISVIGSVLLYFFMKR